MIRAFRVLRRRLQAPFWAARLGRAEGPHGRTHALNPSPALPQERVLLPAIWFIFSRKECEAAAARLARSGLQLTSEAREPEPCLGPQGLKDPVSVP